MQNPSGRHLWTALALITAGLACLVLSAGIGFGALENSSDQTPAARTPLSGGQPTKSADEKLTPASTLDETLPSEPTAVLFEGPITEGAFNEKLAACGAFANGSVHLVRATTRFFFSLPQDLFPDVHGFEFVSVDDNAGAGWISNAGRFGHAFDARPGCWRYYYEFVGVGKTILTARSPVSGAPEYQVQFIIQGPD
ncbi:MAG TPA: hypothetical protein VFP63_04965 [Dehalococcoidia bacterium]|nr:hypothetical protein [Dehalococcoidia bacterium]